MNEPNESNNVESNKKMIQSEGIAASGERAYVERDKRTIRDDLEDYKFLSPRKRRSSKKHHHHHHHHHRKMKAWKKALIIIGSVLMALVILFAGTAVFLVNQGRNEMLESHPKIVPPENVDAMLEDNGMYISYNGERYKYNENIANILFMGVDKRDLDMLNDEGTGGQSDVNVMVALDLKKHKITMVAVPRDAMTDVALYTPAGSYNGMEKMQLCLAYAYGDGKEKSCENVIASMKNIFYNIPIKTYYALDIDGINAINDAIGGVNVISPETIDTFVEGEMVHLEGTKAESFVRSRDKQNVDGNIKRFERQKVYARSFISTLFAQTKKNITTPVSLFNKSAPYSVTNLNPAKVAFLAQELLMGGGMDIDIISVSGETKLSKKTGYTEFTINEEEFFKQFLSVYYEKM